MPQIQKRKSLHPVAKDEVPFLSFAALQNAMTDLEKATKHLSEVFTAGKLTAEQKSVDQQKIIPGRTTTADGKRPSPPRLVPAQYLCTWILYWIWCKNTARYPRSTGTAQLERSTGKYRSGWRYYQEFRRLSRWYC